MRKESHYSDNTYAYNIEGNAVHISEVDSGKNGYYCMGCNAELIARRGEIRAQVFAHAPRDVNIERKCTYSDETYRHKLAKDILQRIKKIKVPSVYRYPPTGVIGSPYKILDSRFIEAYEVRIERQFYESETGEIRYGQKIDFEISSDKYLLIQPDVTFFDKDGKPVLFIEIVATHKVDYDKLAKIRRLGIDTVQVTIPKDSPESIEKCFYTTERIKWIYNHDKETTLYVSTPKGNTKGIPPIDEFERKLLKAEESYRCRSSQISNLIRGIGKCLGTELYRKSTREFRREIERVEENSERYRNEWIGIQRAIVEGVEKEIEGERKLVDEREYGVKRNEGEIRKYQANLEERYYRKKAEIGESQGTYRASCEEEIRKFERDLEALGIHSASFEEQKAALRKEEERIRKIEEEERRIINNFESRRRNSPEKNIETEQRIRRHFEQKIRRIKSKVEESEREFRKRFEEDRRRVIQSIKERDSSGVTRINKRIRNLLDSRELLFSIRKGQGSIERNRKIKEILDSRAWKDWV